MYQPNVWKRAAAKGIMGLVALCVVFTASADDRDLLRNATSDPQMFVTFDTSGSMHWTPGCSELDAMLDIDPWDGKCTLECTFGNTLCQQLCPDQGCVEYDLDVDDIPNEVEIIVDTEDSSGVTITGTWNIGGLEPWQGANYLHNNREGQGDKSIRFTPTLTDAGIYHVYLFWSSNSDRATNVPVTVVHKDGISRVVLDQTQGDGEYNYVGTYEFESGTSGNVLVGTENTTGYVAVDAARFFTVVAPDPAPSCDRTGYRCLQDLCPKGDCFASLAGDDPTSKFFQAKQALYEVIDRSQNVHFGFGSYEQDNGRAMAKHWAYRVADSEDDLFWEDSAMPFPQRGAQFVFGNGAPYNADGQGDGWNCASFNNYRGKLDNDGNFIDPEGDAGQVGCFFTEPADNSNPWELERLRRIPKLGIDGDVDTPVWYRRNDNENRIYRFTFKPVGTITYGDATMEIDIERVRCTDAACTGGTATTNRVTFELVSDFMAWEGPLSRPPMRGNGFFEWQANVSAGNTCNGLEPNDDRDANVDPTLAFSDDDTWWDYTYKWGTTADPRGDSVIDADGNTVTPRVDWFDIGDFVPLDWTATNKNMLKQRMAPNTVGGDLIPDFRTATYWANSYLATSDPDSPANRRLRLKDEAERPLLPFGSTPIAASLNDFADWFAGEDDTTLQGWSGVAASRDIDWACREKYVLFLTDGNETCGGDPCQAAKELNDLGVKTFVVGFGLDDESSSLGCIAEKGGTEEPILPRNKNELVEALEAILLQIKSESKSFASASIPAIQSTAADKIYLSSFIPLPGQSVWPGEIDVFRKPLPLKEGRPDVERKCVDPDDTSLVRQSACHLYEVGELLVENQAPTLTELTSDPPELRIGPEKSDRRLIYSQANYTGQRPSELVLLREPYRGGDGLDTTDIEDLAEKLVDEDLLIQYYLDGALPEEVALDPLLVTADDLEEEIMDVIKRTLLPRDLGVAAEGDREEYLLGDIFHANPTIIAGPSDFQYFSSDLCGKLESDAVPDNCVLGEDRGYRRFAREHVWRRRMLVSATNDGQLHFFDAGTRVEATIDGGTDKVEVFTDGTGVELFSYIPRLTLPAVREQANGDRHMFSLDGEMVTRDVFIDPSHPTGGVDPGEREWRTVLMAGMREAGDIYEQADGVDDLISGYFALDITQPDAQKQRSTDVDDGGDFNDPPQESLLPLNASGAAGTNDLPSCFDFDFDGDGHQNTPTATAPAGGLFPCRHKFPAELWLFTDSVENGLYYLDEEENADGTYGNGVRDLGDTWSRPVIGQIRICDGNKCDPEGDGRDLTSMHVAIFGGGMDPDYKEIPQKGYWIYIVDMETGNAIYKRRLDGSAPADPAVLDTDQDGLLDAIYIGTTNGTLYKIDLDGRDSFGDVPGLSPVDVRDRLIPALGPGAPINVDRIDDDSGWDPFPILYTDDNVPLYFAPTAFFIPELNAYGLAVGTGDREDLWVPTTKEGRLYVIVDEHFTRDEYLASIASGECTTELPIVDSCLENIAWNADPPVIEGTDEIDNSIDFLLDPFVPDDDDATGFALRPGYVMTFPATHRITSQPFVASGILIYSVFQPVAFIANSGDDDDDDDDGGGSDDVVCARTGTTRAFVVLARNANPVARLSGVEQGEDPDIDGTVIDDPTGTGGDPIDDDEETSGALKSRDRYHKIGEFTTAPFIDRSATKNDPDTQGGATVNSVLESEVSAALQKAIADTFPRGSRFNTAFSLTIAALRNSTGVNVYATIPIAVYPADWKEE